MGILDIVTFTQRVRQAIASRGLTIAHVIDEDDPQPTFRVWPESTPGTTKTYLLGFGDITDECAKKLVADIEAEFPSKGLIAYPTPNIRRH